LAGDGGDDGGLGSGVDLEPLSLASSGLGASGTGISLAGESGSSSSHKESSGISIFDDDLESADPNAQTQVTSSRNVEFADKGSSAGSGLLEAAREADDTSLGADILGNVYGDQQETMSSTATDAGGGGALFETTGAEIADSPAISPMMQMEAFDGKGSGLAGGLALGMVLTLALAIAVAVFSITGMSGGLLETITTNFWAVVGGLGGFTLIAGVIGMVVGGKS
ncbi:MAG: hypothetical protein KDA05_02445, partial [Phycisphaerales bacterium]|nr:hypothetical protein [Phycisphaerales bacterium]